MIFSLFLRISDLYVRLVLTVSTQPVDKSQRTEVYPPFTGFRLFILHPLDRDEPGLRKKLALCSSLCTDLGKEAYMGSFP